MSTEIGGNLLCTLRKAYTEAVDLFRMKQTSDEAKTSRIKDTYNIDDVFAIVVEAKAKYEGRIKESKARRWLSALSTRIIYYGQILDVLSQHHPEYVSLAWGTIKFLFILVLNHEEMISELAKAVTKIADVLPRVKLQLETFQTEWMKDAIQKLYADIVNFLVRGLQWYEQGSLRHTFRAFSSPYKLLFQDLRDKIDESARRIDDMAITLSHAQISEMYKMIVRMENSINSYHLVHLFHFSGLSQGVNQIQVAQILEAMKDTQLPSAIESLRFCQAVRRRRVGRYEFDQSTLLPKLQEWSVASSSSMITIGGSAPTRFQTKDLATEMVELIENADKPVIWALKGRQASKPEEIQIDLLKHLTSQAVQLNNNNMIGHVSASFNAPRVQSARTEADWLQILKESLNGLSEIYVVVDMETLGLPFEGSYQSWLEFLGHFEALLHSVDGVVVKVVILSFRQDFIRFLGSASQTTIVPLRKKNVRSTGAKVKKSQPGRRKNISGMKFR
ncbi:hypothetical protein AOQ84DRAFT_402968 [Glonium stellatum]|uniref:DUF7708 domain-containing protein n=1 Tax=Glonium stellatum TaxID=574774 RepID=A0A8E2JLF2_9PEZI|nr:hypothetical protein AOQ84DRAFT_402968 [Glonium stellatum]